MMNLKGKLPLQHLLFVRQRAGKQIRCVPLARSKLHRDRLALLRAACRSRASALRGPAGAGLGVVPSSAAEAIFDRDDEPNLLRLEPDERRPRDSRQDRDVIQFANQPLDPNPAGHVAAVEVHDD